MAAIEFERKRSRTDNIASKETEFQSAANNNHEAAVLHEDKEATDVEMDDIDETAALSPKDTASLRATHSISRSVASRSAIDPKNRLSIRMPSVPRLKSRLKSPNTILNNSKTKYNMVGDSTMTGQTIPNTLKSSVDIMLYDPTDIDDDTTNDDTPTTATPEQTSSANNDNDNMIDYNISDTMQSSGDLNENDTFFDDDDPIHHQINNHNKAMVKCKCCSWLNKYKSSIIISIVLCIVLICLQLSVDDDDISMSIIYWEFALFVLTLWLLFRLVWGLISYVLFVCTANHWCVHNLETFVFYIQHSIYYLGYGLFSTFCYAFFCYQQTHPGEMERFTRLIDFADAKVVESIEKFFLCAMVLFWGLFIKTILIRWICLQYYLSSHLVKIKRFRKYESWLKILLNKRQIFSVKVKKFLDLNELQSRAHQYSELGRVHKTVAFRLDVLASQEEFNLDHDGIALHKMVMQKIDECRDSDSEAVDKNNESLNSTMHESIGNKLVNTLTSGSMFYGLQRKYDHNIQTCLLWLYNAKTGRVTVMDDNELDKVCKQFAKFITLSVTKKRLDATTPRSTRNVDRRPTFRELTTMFARHAGGNTSTQTAPDDKDQLRRTSTLNKPVPRLKRSSMTVGGEFVTQSEFIRCFVKLNRARQGHEAWKAMNVSEKFLSKNELQRWLYQYLHDLIYLKQTLNSYQEILSNLDMSSNFIAIFVLFFIFLLIFKFNFIDSVSIYFSMIAIFAVFGKNVFTQFFDALYFIFIFSPFEIGDVILIDDVRYTVNKINIMSTELMTAVSNGNTLVIKNNASLLGKDIKNLSKTKSPYHNLTFYISQNTSIDELNQLKFKIDSFVRHKMKNDFNDIWFILDGVDKECRMKIRLFLGSIYSFSDSGLMWKQHHIINMQIRKFVNEMGIQYKRFSDQDIQLSALIEEQEMSELR